VSYVDRSVSKVAGCRRPHLQAVEHLLLTPANPHFCRNAVIGNSRLTHIYGPVRDTAAARPDGSALALTVTPVLAEVGAEEDLASALARADAALYTGKAAGCDRWVIAGEAGGPPA